MFLSATFNCVLLFLVGLACASAPIELHPDSCKKEFSSSNSGVSFLVYNYPGQSTVGYDMEYFATKNYFRAGDFVTAGLNNVALYFNSSDPDANFEGVNSLYKMAPFTFVQYGLFTAPSSGAHKFRLQASNGVSVQLGQGIDCCNDFNTDGVSSHMIVATDTTTSPVEGIIFLEKDAMYPLRIVFWHKSGPVVMRWDMWDPEGNPVNILKHVRQEPDRCTKLST